MEQSKINHAKVYVSCLKAITNFKYDIFLESWEKYGSNSPITRKQCEQYEKEKSKYIAAKKVLKILGIKEMD